jgi:receptor expression-enhancing protein 1/2/3/4
LPFYWEVKTLLLLFLSLPQFEARATKGSLFSPKCLLIVIPSFFFFLFFPPAPQGSTYVYKTYVEPYLVQNESDIDANIASARSETFQFIQSRLSTLWDLLYSLLSRTPMTSKLLPPGVTQTNGSPHVGENALFKSVQGLWGAINSPAFSAAPSAVNGNHAVSRSASDTIASEKQAPSHAQSTDTSVSAGYDVDEGAKN